VARYYRADGRRHKLEQIERTGIRNLSPEEVQHTLFGMRYKLMFLSNRTCVAVVRAIV